MGQHAGVRILVANPNTTPAVTDLVAAHARATAAPGTEIVPATARFGPRIIGTRAERAVAEHAALDLIAREADGCDAVVVAASTDSGVRAARELLAIPVIGLTEAALHTACLLGGTFATVTLSTRSNGMLREQITMSGLTGRCTAMRAVEASPLDVLDHPARLAMAIGAALQGVDADVIVLVGAVMAGVAAQVRADAARGVPVLEGVACAIAMAEALTRLDVNRKQASGGAAIRLRESVGLDPQLAAKLGDIA